MNSKLWRRLLPAVLFLFLVVGILETPFVAPRLFPKLFWAEHLGRAERRVKRAERELKEAEEKYNKLKMEALIDPGKQDDLRRAEASRQFHYEFGQMIKDKRDKLERASRGDRPEN